MDAGPKVGAAARAPEKIEERWAAWLLQRNRGGLRTLLFIVLTLYPAFGAIDYLSAPREALPWLWATRALVTAVTLLMFRVLRSPVFERRADLLSSAFMLLCASGISVMTVFMGGLNSPYYAGLTLAVVATGLLFVWPARVVVATHGLIVAGFVAGNLARWGMPANATLAAMNLAFLSSTALICGIGQIFAYRSQRAQMAAALELEVMTSELQRAHAELRAQSEFKSRFFANMTHELRTPLAMILTPLELALEGELGKLTPPQRGSFETMFRNALKLLKLINDLLDLSKLEESKLRLRICELDLVEHLRGLTQQTQVLAQRKGIDLRFFPEHDQHLVWCDPERMERVFINLLSNAIKFTEPGGRVQVWLLEQQDSVRVVVEDSGPGFPPDKADKLFERFYQVDMGGTRRHGGTGIGLALAKELVLLHDGAIRARSEPGKGAAFTVELKKGREHFRPEVLDRRGTKRDRGATGQRSEDRGLTDWAVQLASREDFKLLDIAEATERRVIGPPEEDGRKRRHTALVVEDTPDVIRLLHLSLRNDFRVIAAQDGQQGWELAQRERPSLVITDLMMPGIDGLELTRRLRADPRTSSIPIIMLTARGDLQDRITGLDTGASAYLAKPFSVKELLSCARGLVREQEKTAELVLTQRMDALEMVAAGLAHEINNPLNYVKNALGRIRGDSTDLVALASAAVQAPLDEAQRKRLEKAAGRIAELIGVADSGLKRIGGTVKLMEGYGRAGYQRVQRPYDVFAAVREVIEVVLPATGRHVRVEADLQGDGVVECVPEELNQLLSNLVQNAIEAVQDGEGVVRVVAEAAEQQLTLRVIDNGCGIKPEDQQRLFTPFFTTKGPGRGTGLGLTIAWRVVQSLDGGITARSEPGRGTEFVVTLPRKQAGRVETPLGVQPVARAG